MGLCEIKKKLIVLGVFLWSALLAKACEMQCILLIIEY